MNTAQSREKGSRKRGCMEAIIPRGLAHRCRPAFPFDSIE
jgi:hypothetical protein